MFYNRIGVEKKAYLKLGKFSAYRRHDNLINVARMQVQLLRYLHSPHTRCTVSKDLEIIT